MDSKSVAKIAAYLLDISSAHAFLRHFVNLLRRKAINGYPKAGPF